MLCRYWQLTTVAQFVLLVTVFSQQHNCDNDVCYKTTTNAFWRKNDVYPAKTDNEQTRNPEVVAKDQQFRSRNNGFRDGLREERSRYSLKGFRKIERDGISGDARRQQFFDGRREIIRREERTQTVDRMSNPQRLQRTIKPERYTDNRRVERQIPERRTSEARRTSSPSIRIVSRYKNIVKEQLPERKQRPGNIERNDFIQREESRQILLTDRQRYDRMNGLRLHKVQQQNERRTLGTRKVDFDKSTEQFMQNGEEWRTKQNQNQRHLERVVSRTRISPYKQIYNERRYHEQEQQRKYLPEKFMKENKRRNNQNIDQRIIEHRKDVRYDSRIGNGQRSLDQTLFKKPQEYERIQSTHRGERYELMNHQIGTNKPKSQQVHRNENRQDYRVPQPREILERRSVNYQINKEKMDTLQREQRQIKKENSHNENLYRNDRSIEQSPIINSNRDTRFKRTDTAKWHNNESNRLMLRRGPITEIQRLEIPPINKRIDRGQRGLSSFIGDKLEKFMVFLKYRYHGLIQTLLLSFIMTAALKSKGELKNRIPPQLRAALYQLGY